MSPVKTEDEISKHQPQLDWCTMKCFDTQSNLLPKMWKTMKTVLSDSNAIPLVKAK